MDGYVVMTMIHSRGAASGAETVLYTSRCASDDESGRRHEQALGSMDQE